MHVRTWGELWQNQVATGNPERLLSASLSDFLASFSILCSDRSSEGDFLKVTEQDSSRGGLGSWARDVSGPSLNPQGTTRGIQGSRNPRLGQSQAGVSSSPSILLIYQVVFLRGTISAFGESRVPGIETLRGPWAVECRPSCQLSKEQFPGKPMGMCSQHCGWGEQGYQGAQALPGDVGGDPRHRAMGG